jgi:hypothetical protein
MGGQGSFRGAKSAQINEAAYALLARSYREIARSTAILLVKFS